MFPGAYDVALRRTLGGGKLSMSKVPSDVELAIQRAKRQPGPGSYHIEQCPLLRPIGSALGGGKISGSQIKSDIEWSMQRAKQQPGPLDYFPDEHTRVLGGRISSGRIKSDVDIAVARASDTPGPGEYYPNLLSIGWRYGGLPHTPSIATRKSERQIHIIPPEARRRPRPPSTPAAGDSASRTRSASSLGHAGGPVAEDPSGPGDGADPGAGAGAGRAGLPALRARSVSPTSWVLPQSAAAAYGVRASVDKPRKRRNVCNLRVEVDRFRVLPSAFDLARAAEAQAQVPRDPAAPRSEARTATAMPQSRVCSGSSRGAGAAVGQGAGT
jgi:hypothetical protein